MSDAEKTSESGAFSLGSLDDTLRSMAKPGLELSDSVTSMVSDVMEAAVELSERVRENVLEKQAVERAREKGVAKTYREQAHRFVDVAADVMAVVTDGVRGWIETEGSIAEEPVADSAKKAKKA